MSKKAIYIIIAALLIIGVGFTTWYLIDNKGDDSDKEVSISQNDEQATVVAEAKMTPEFPELDFTLPDGWKITLNDYVDHKEDAGYPVYEIIIKNTAANVNLNYSIYEVAIEDTQTPFCFNEKTILDDPDFSMKINNLGDNWFQARHIEDQMFDTYSYTRTLVDGSDDVFGAILSEYSSESENTEDLEFCGYQKEVNGEATFADLVKHSSGYYRMIEFYLFPLNNEAILDQTTDFLPAKIVEEANQIIKSTKGVTSWRDN